MKRNGRGDGEPKDPAQRLPGGDPPGAGRDIAQARLQVNMGRVAEGIRHARRWMRRRFNRVAGAGSSGGRYVPDCRGHRLHAVLAAAEDGRPGAVEQQPAGVGMAAALGRARERFGGRFFVSPEAISPLWRRLREEYPQWPRRQMEAVRADTEAGIPIYSLRGPRIGADFPWEDPHPAARDDGLYAKRPHRFAFAPRHALACHHDSDAAGRLRGMLEGWINRARSGRDPHCYDSNLVVIQRLLALSWSWVFLTGCGTADSPERQDLEWTVLRIIEADIRFLEPRLGDSAANNHLLADRFAAWYLRAVFPELLDTAGDGEEELRWRDELLYQTYPDGGSFEHSAHYHEFACEMGAAYLLLCRRQGRPPDPAIEARVAALLHFQAALTGPEAVPLPFGNGIEDTLFPLDPDEGWCPGSLRELYRALFRPGLEPTRTDNPSWVRAFWLLGGNLAAAPANPVEPAAMESFSESGFHVMPDTEPEARMIFRTGPAPGVQVVPGHMHADLLAIYLSVAGHPLIVDAGTYSYRSLYTGCDAQALPWRQYFAGPRAHNGPIIDNLDPLGALTRNFRRTGETVRAAVTCQRSNDLALVDGGLIASDPYGNTRRMVIHVLGKYWLVVDIPTATPGRSGSISYGFQFDAGSRIAGTGNGLTIEHPNCAHLVHLAAGGQVGTPDVYEGDMDPIAGWVSPRYGELLEAPQARFGISGPIRPVVFVIQVGQKTPLPPEVSINEFESDTFQITVKFEDFEDMLFVGCRDAGYPPNGNDQLSFRGDLLWLRSFIGVPHEVRWLGARHLSLPGIEPGCKPAGVSGRYRFP